MDFVAGIMAWGVSGSGRFLTPGKESLCSGSRQILPAALCAPDLQREVGVVLGNECGRVSTPCPSGSFTHYIYFSASSVLCWRFVSIFLLCAGWSLKWASLQDRLGCSGAPLPAFSLAGLQHSQTAVGLMPE